MQESALDTAARLFAGIEAGRSAEVSAIYADGIEVWHNFSNRIQTKAENLRTLEGLIASAGAIRYEVIERLALDDRRVMQRHNLRVRTAQGEEFVIPACIFITVDDGRIVRIDEYLDTGQANALRRASGRETVPG